jgi:hypothetical protein
MVEPNLSVTFGQQVANQISLARGRGLEELRRPREATNPQFLGSNSAIWRMSALTSAETSLSAGLREWDFQRQKKRKPARCQRTTVSGLTTTRTSAQRDQRRVSTSRKARSDLPRRGRKAPRNAPRCTMAGPRGQTPLSSSSPWGNERHG